MSVGDTKFEFRENNERSDLIAFHATPEQAIAATLTHYHVPNVEDALALLDEMNEQGRIEYADYSQLHDAIAATLGSGTCELAYCEDDEGYDGWYCQSCGGWFDAARRGGRLVEPMRCGCCGKAVER